FVCVRGQVFWRRARSAGNLSPARQREPAALRSGVTGLPGFAVHIPFELLLGLATLHSSQLQAHLRPNDSQDPRADSAARPMLIHSALSQLGFGAVGRLPQPVLAIPPAPPARPQWPSV